MLLHALLEWSTASSMLLSVKLKSDVALAVVRQQQDINTNPTLRHARSKFSAGSHPAPGSRSSSLGQKANL